MVNYELSKHYLEKNACFVVALTEVSGEDYYFIHTFVRHVMNRRLNDCTLMGEIEKNKKQIKKLGIDFKKVKIAKEETVETFAEKNQSGKFVLFTEGHAIALVDGIVKDSKEVAKIELQKVYQA